ncbi:uncharacterized protein LOC125003698 isoform X2 [Mugil cephalus]|uniref:uncharacterized protein LOC125003698 isoform X2 n=1 Tax=Mugil cephalus TaxID=48193 RepID=UPI001FB614D6|nr:uncharacterized protein LOC125003698 isoform X2 [Mugil cephalus]
MYGDNMQRVEHEAAWPLEKQTSIKEQSGSGFWSSSYGPFAGSACVDHFSLDPNRTKPEVHSTVGQMHQINTPTLFSPELFDEHGPSSYRFRSSSAGVFQCKLTRLVFKMTQGGELVYWIIQWDEDLLNSAGKTPAGPLFSISCSEGSVSQLHLPHCGNLPGLSVVHISNDGMSILQPLEITASHVVVDVPHLSAFGLVWDIIKRLLNIQIQICGQVLLFYRPQYKNQSQKLNVFLLPENVPLQEVKCQQKMAEYIEAPSSCLLTTGQFYSLLCPEAHMIQPECALFDLKYGPNYHPTFDIRMTPNTKEVTVRVRDQEERHVWAYRAELPDVQAAPAFSLLSAQPPSTEPGSSSLVTSDRRGGRPSSAPGPSSQLIHTITSDSASSMHGLVTDGGVQAAPAFSLLSAQPPSTEPGSSSLVTSDRRGGRSFSAPGPSSQLTHTITRDSSSLHGLVTDGGPHPSCYNPNMPLTSHVQEDKKLKSVRVEFINRVSDPVLKNLLDELLQKEVINSSELEEMQALSKADKARKLIDTVVKKGPEACKVMIDAFRILDPFVFETLNLH